MIDFGSDTFLDMINLLIQENYAKPLSRTNVVEVISKLLTNIQEYIRVETIYDTEENRYYVELLQELINRELTLEDKSQLNIFASKYLRRYPKNEEPANKRILSDILLNESPIDEKYKHMLFRKLRLILMWCLSDKEIKSISYKMKKIAHTTDLLTQETVFNDIFSQAKDIINEIKIIGSSTDDALNIEHINMSDKESIKKALIAHRVTRATTIFKTGLHGINKMLGPGGFTLGETVLFAALSHNYKSGILMDAGRWVVSYTEAPRFDNKQPVVLFISLENEAHKNLMNWYRRSYTLINGKYPPADLSDDEITDLVNKAYSMNGWEFHVIRRIGDYFGFDDYLQLMEEYKKLGKKVYVSIIDYPALMRLGYKNTVIDSSSMKASHLQDLYRKIGNHNKHENILGFTAQQLGPDAGVIAASGCIYPVKKFQGGAHLADCKSIYKEVDTCILMHIERNANKQSFLTFHWSKHRDNIAPPFEDQFTAYPFTHVGILDDAMLPNSQAVSDIYSYRAVTDNIDDIEDTSIFN